MALGLPTFVLYVWGGCVGLWFIAILIVLIRAGVIRCCRRYARKSVTKAARRADTGQLDEELEMVTVADIFVPTNEQRQVAEELFIDRGAIVIGKMVAQTSRVYTYKAVLKLDQDRIPSSSGGTRKPVCCRMVGDKTSDLMHNLFEHELYLTSGIGKHHSVVSLFGTYTASEPHIIVIEYLPRGNLRDILRISRTEKSKRFTQRQQFELMAQIAEGMTFLSSQQIVHCNVSLANVWIGGSNIAKVANFIAARKMELQGARMCYRKTDHAAVVSFKWQAPEVLTEKVFTSASDVWAFGVSLWELGTLGGSPYPKYAPDEVLENVARGSSMTKHPYLSHTSDAFFNDLVEKCWLAEAKERPTFAALADLLRRFTKSSRQHLRSPERPPTFGDPYDSMKLADVLEVLDDELRVPDPTLRPLPAPPTASPNADRPLPPLPPPSDSARSGSGSGYAAVPPQARNRESSRSRFKMPAQDEEFGAAAVKGSGGVARGRIASLDADYESPDEDDAGGMYEKPDFLLPARTSTRQTSQTQFGRPAEPSPVAPSRPSLRSANPTPAAAAAARASAKPQPFTAANPAATSPFERGGQQQRSVINPVAEESMAAEHSRKARVPPSAPAPTRDRHAGNAAAAAPNGQPDNNDDGGHYAAARNPDSAAPEQYANARRPSKSIDWETEGGGPTDVVSPVCTMRPNSIYQNTGSRAAVLPPETETDDGRDAGHPAVAAGPPSTAAGSNASAVAPVAIPAPYVNVPPGGVESPAEPEAESLPPTPAAAAAERPPPATTAPGEASGEEGAESALPYENVPAGGVAPLASSAPLSPSAPPQAQGADEADEAGASYENVPVGGLGPSVGPSADTTQSSAVEPPAPAEPTEPADAARPPADDHEEDEATGVAPPAAADMPTTTAASSPYVNVDTAISAPPDYMNSDEARGDAPAVAAEADPVAAKAQRDVYSLPWNEGGQKEAASTEPDTPETAPETTVPPDAANTSPPAADESAGAEPPAAASPEQDPAGAEGDEVIDYAAKKAQRDVYSMPWGEGGGPPPELVQGSPETTAAEPNEHPPPESEGEAPAASVDAASADDLDSSAAEGDSHDNMDTHPEETAPPADAIPTITTEDHGDETDDAPSALRQQSTPPAYSAAPRFSFRHDSTSSTAASAPPDPDELPRPVSSLLAEAPEPTLADPPPLAAAEPPAATEPVVTPSAGAEAAATDAPPPEGVAFASELAAADMAGEPESGGAEDLPRPVSELMAEGEDNDAAGGTEGSPPPPETLSEDTAAPQSDDGLAPPPDSLADLPRPASGVLGSEELIEEAEPPPPPPTATEHPTGDEAGAPEVAVATTPTAEVAAPETDDTASPSERPVATEPESDPASADISGGEDVDLGDTTPAPQPQPAIEPAVESPPPETDEGDGSVYPQASEQTEAAVADDSERGAVVTTAEYEVAPGTAAPQRTLYEMPPPFKREDEGGAVETEAFLAPPTKTGTLVHLSLADSEVTLASPPDTLN
eukprot:m.134725 g.134725  ORF g.134725 m.134725 type:complete len:1501 (+) comp13880_c1_seq2:77-4579(+)